MKIKLQLQGQGIFEWSHMVMYHQDAYQFIKINKPQILPNNQVPRLTWTKGWSGTWQYVYYPQKNLPWQEHQGFSPLCSVFNNLYHDFVVRQHICVHVHIYYFLLIYIYLCSCISVCIAHGLMLLEAREGIRSQGNEVTTDYKLKNVGIGKGTQVFYKTNKSS